MTSTPADIRTPRLKGRTPVPLLVAFPLLAIYLATATWSFPYHIDALTNALTGWYMGTEGTVVMSEHTESTGEDRFGVVGWIVDSPQGAVSQYPPGAAVLAAPIYALSGSELTPVTVTSVNRPDLGEITLLIPPLWPATLTAVVATSLAAALLAMAVEPTIGRRWAIGSGLAFGLATGAWAVASNMLWTHGPGLLWIAAALYFLSQDRQVLAGFAFGAAVLTRPHLAAVAAVSGVIIGLSQRRLAPVIRVGAGSAVGLAALVIYNWSVFGQPSIRGGYHGGFVDNLVDPDIGAYVSNVWGALFGVSNGLIPWAPFLIVLVVGIPAVWRRTPAWAKGAALGGLLYLLIQLKANRFSGGEGHFAYRYPLEALMAAAPLLVISARYWVWNRPVVRSLLLIGLLAAAGAQALGAIVGLRIV